jgi:hypothetical protein
MRGASLAAALLGVAFAIGANAQNHTPCVSFPEQQLQDISRRPDATMIAWRALATNSCGFPVDVEATFTLNDPDGTPIAERRSSFRLVANETVEVRGDFAVEPPSKAERIGWMTVVYLAR